MMRNIISMVALLSLAACDFGEVYKTETRDTVIVAVKRPKRFGLTVRDTQTGQDFRISVSKRCSNWRSAKVGARTPVVFEYRRYEDGRTTVSAQSTGLRTRFC